MYMDNMIDMKNEVMIKFINNEITTIPLTLNNNITHDGIRFAPRLELNDLINHINEFLDGNYQNRYFILPGLRGVGKTTILYQLYDYLLNEKNISQNQILYLSCDKLNKRFKFNILDVVECFLKYHHNSTLRTLDKEIFLLIDESQYDYDWHVSGKIIHDDTNKIFIIFTGSSALDLEYNADSARRFLKRNITPLTYNQYLKLWYGFDAEMLSESLSELLFTGNVGNAINCEKEVIPQLYNIQGYYEGDWEDFIHYGGFPTSFYEKNTDIITEKLVEIVSRVISKDLPRMGNISSDNLVNAARLLNFLALQQPGEVSQNNMANYLDCSATTVKNILEILEKTHLLFHCEPYGSASTRYKKSWKYFFATSSLRHILNQDLDNPIQNQKAYEGILLENFVAASLFNLKNRKNFKFKLFYDAKSKNKNVDFLIQKGSNRPIPIEVGVGKKNKKQIVSSMNKFKSDYGIIIANNYQSIKKDGNVIFVSPKTFSFL